MLRQGRFAPQLAALAVSLLSVTACDSGGGAGAKPVLTGTSPTPAVVTLTAIQVGPATDGAVSATVGTPVQLVAVGTYSDGSIADLTASVAWTSSSADVATVDAGLVDPLAVGTAEVAATDPGSGLASSVTLTVSAEPVPVTLDGVQIGPATDGVVSLAVGDTWQLAVTGTYSDGSTADLTSSFDWTSSNPDVATVVAGLITGIGAGEAVVTATDPETGVSSSVTVSVSVVVDRSQIVALAIDPLDPSILIGTTLQLDAWGIFADDTTIDLPDLSWTSSNEAVATVSGGGLVTALSLGVTTVTVTDPVTGLAASTTVEVTDVPGALSYLKVSPRSVIGGGLVAVRGTVALTSIVDGPVVIALSTSKDAATVPVFVIVPAGANRLSFEIVTSAVTHNTLLFVRASDGTFTKKSTLNVRAAN